MTAQEEQLQIRIRELEKEVARLHSQIKEQRYGLTWLDVPEAFETDSENKIPILEEVKDKAIDNGGDCPPHILIEGDNYHALTCLNYTHRGKIDVIYIDPPYNTGNDGFTYKDKRILKEFPDGSPVPKEHPLRHSYWLSFMSKRLELAKNLLSDKGVIFISIDDNEQANLKLLCDKVFGEENFIVDFIWRGGRRNMSKWVSTSHEYMLAYAKNLAICNLLSVEWNEKKQGLLEIYQIASRFVKETNKDYEKASLLLKNWFKDLPDSNASKDHSHYCWIDEQGVYFASDISRGGGGGPKWNIKNPFTGNYVKTPLRGWAYSTIEELNDDIKKGVIHFNGDGVPCKKRHLKDNETQILESVFYKDRRGSSKRLRDLMGNDVFPFPKDEIVLADKIKSFGEQSSIILDFFAGSGTTMHATMKLNAEDGGHRQCILVQQKEGDNNICENVTYERNKRVICGYTNAKGEQVEGLGGKMKYYKTAFVGKNQSKNATDADRIELAQKAGCLLALGENTLEEVSKSDDYQIYTSGGKYTAIFFTEHYIKLPEFVAEVEKLQQANAEIVVYIFSWGTPEIFENEFDNLRGITLKAIPQPILDVYKSLNR